MGRDAGRNAGHVSVQNPDDVVMSSRGSWDDIIQATWFYVVRRLE